MSDDQCDLCDNRGRRLDRKGMTSPYDGMPAGASGYVSRGEWLKCAHDG